VNNPGELHDRSTFDTRCYIASTPCDIDCLADFEAERQQPGTIAYAADSEGRLLYASPGSPFRDRWRAQAIRQ
jgi:hypothetical protein